MGGQAATQVIQGERQFDLVVRMQEPFRSDENAIRNLLIATPDGQYLPLSQFADIRVESGASFIYRESNSRYIGVQFSVEGRDLAGAVGEARKKVDAAVKLPIGYRFDWGGEYKEYLASQQQMKVILPLTVRADPADPVRAIREPEIPDGDLLQRPGNGAGGRPAGAAAHAYQFQRLVHAGIRRADGRRGADQRHSVFLHQQAAAGRKGYTTATLEASLLRLRPIMMTALVACFGLLPAAMSTGIGSDSQKPFAIVIVGGLASRLLLSVFLSPVLYALVAREGDILQV